MNMYCTYRQIYIWARICMPLNNNYLPLRAVCGCWCCWRFRFFVVVAIYVWCIAFKLDFFWVFNFFRRTLLICLLIAWKFFGCKCLRNSRIRASPFLKKQKLFVVVFFIMLPPYFINAETSAINNLLAGLTALKLCNVSKLWQNNNSVYFCSIWDESISHSNIGSTDREKNY